MQTLLRLCLWPAIIIGMLITQLPVSAEEDRGIRMRGPQSSDIFPYDRYGPITSKDTLWNIATRILPDTRLSIYQVMQALYQENPQAFVDSNINHLVEGQYLNIPSSNNMMAINAKSAKKKSELDRKAWQQTQPNVSKKAIIAEPSVKKEDLETVKIEINNQLQKLDGQQQKRLATIQNEISDSIDGVQAILKENDDLRQQLSSFSDKLGVMQVEVEKSKEIKLQMDNIINLQKALLVKAEAREKQLILDQQVELSKKDIISSLWFKIAIGTLPAILLLAFLFNRRKQSSGHVFSDELNSQKNSPPAKKENEDDELSLDDDLEESLLDESESKELNQDGNGDSKTDVADEPSVKASDSFTEEATPQEVIQELDNVDFDELLANIEEESTAEQEPVEVAIVDDFIDEDIDSDNFEEPADTVSKESYLSVDDLLSDSMNEVDVSEPYEKTNIDVGLGQFTENDTGVDVDEDGSISSKIDLAKMYIELGDEENAQVILQEIISKGNIDQQVEVQALLDSL